MKHIISFILLLNVVIGMSQNKADDIVGYYLTFDPFSKEYSQCYIYKTSKGTYDGRVCWVSNSTKRIFELCVFKRPKFRCRKQRMGNSKVTYAGKTGTYKTYMKFEDKSKLKVRAYFGVSLLGKTIYWTKRKAKKRTKVK